MARCEVCGSEEELPFVCSYCKGIFCAEHRLPEAHSCPMINIARTIGSTYADVPPPPVLKKTRMQGITGKVEVEHLLLAWLVLSLCFSLRYIFEIPSALPLLFGISLGTVGVGFIVHELTHKFTAQRYGFWSEFRIWPLGLVMTVLFSVISAGQFVFAAPGATYVKPRYSASSSSQVTEDKQNGIISLAGPLSNVALAIIFLLVSEASGLLGSLGALGFQVNLWLAAFNMIPFGGMDGQKVLSWSILIWAAFTIPLWVMVAIQTVV